MSADFYLRIPIDELLDWVRDIDAEIKRQHRMP